MLPETPGNPPERCAEKCCRQHPELLMFDLYGARKYRFSPDEIGVNLSSNVAFWDVEMIITVPARRFAHSRSVFQVPMGRFWVFIWVVGVVAAAGVVQEFAAPYFLFHE